MVFKRDLILISFGRLATALIALVSIRAATSFLSPEKYGQLAILIAIQMLCGLFLINPIGQHINLHTHAWWDEGSLASRLKSYGKYIIFTAFLGALLSLAIIPNNWTDAIYAMAIIFLMIISSTWNATLIPMLNMLGFRATSILLTIATASISLISSIIFVFFWQSAISWFAGQALGMLIGAVCAYFFFRSRTSSFSSTKIRKPLLTREVLLTYCLPLAVAAGLMWIQLSGYRFIIEYYWGLTQLGFFVIGLQLSAQIWALAESLAVQFLYPFFFRKISEYTNEGQVKKAFSDLLNTLIPVYLLLAGFTVLAAPYLMKLLVSAEYREAWGFMIVGAIVELCRALGNTLSNAAHARRDTKSLTTPYAAGVVVILSFLFAAGELKLDIDWAGLALTSGATSMLISMLITMYRQVNFKLDVLRCSFSLTAMLIMILSVFYLPVARDWKNIILVLMTISFFAACSLFLVLWKNPATLSLLSAQLRKI
ncbi:hypothetical protein M5G24_09240 [Pseudomonas sp. TNT2022 ID1048]|uniref:lipopolysaccharide biosynthesis protein n=1 Tax=Pseudomonas TaxID=286 RepID=UPI0011B5BA48|nr:MULTISPECIES: hypothetical protein [Pseudomonas]MDD1019194.1 hypothetical protein [Pseudomonas idahonensis]MDP9535363.1 hypothetical protein [Pseudomonas protegens]